MLERCSTDHAPWYVIPSNHKWFRNLAVSRILADTLDDLRMKLPKPTVDLDAIRKEYHAARPGNDATPPGMSPAAAARRLSVPDRAAAAGARGAGEGPPSGQAARRPAIGRKGAGRRPPGPSPRMRRTALKAPTPPSAERTDQFARTARKRRCRTRRPSPPRSDAGMTLTLAVFLLVYVAMGVGQVPGFKVDRTGAAIVGALVLIAAGRIGPQAAWDAIDYRTVGLLFGLMVVSAAFVVSGFYGWAAHRVATLDVCPPVLLAILVAVAGLLSAVLTNDVVVVAMTPLLVAVTLSRGLNPVPFLLGFCFAANAGSAGTIIGSPQNMIAAQGLGISFNGFLRIAAAAGARCRCRSSGRSSRSSTAAAGTAPPPAPPPRRRRPTAGRPPRPRSSPSASSLAFVAHRLAEGARRARRRRGPARQPLDRLVRHARARSTATCCCC